MGTWNPFRGLTDESLCIPCNPGLVCSAEGTENNKPFGDNIAQVVNEFIGPCEAELDTCESVELQPLGRATLCPEGYVCDARTTVAAVKCPDGYFCGYGTSPETQFVNKCPAGYFCPEGTAASGRFQFPCSACHFCPEGTGVILPRCPEGTRSDPNADDIDEILSRGVARMPPPSLGLMRPFDQQTSSRPGDGPICSTHTVTLARLP